MKTKTEILDSIFRHLVSIGKVKTQQDIVDAIGGNNKVKCLCLHENFFKTETPDFTAERSFKKQFKA